MDNKVIFELDNTIDFRNNCCALPGGSIPVAMIVNSTLVILGSPNLTAEEIVSWISEGWNFTVADMDMVKSGRGNFFPLVQNAD